MSVRQLCTISELTPLNGATFRLILEVEASAEWENVQPGQFLHIACGPGLLLRRPISIALAASDGTKHTVTLVFEIRGEGTKWLSQQKPGDKLDVLGPLGRGFSMVPEGRYLLAGGGIGVPPLLGCAGLGRERTDAVLGFRSADRAILADRFREYCKTVTLCSDDGSIGRHGFVDAQVRDFLVKDNSFTAVLACGPKPMLKRVAAVAAEFGVPCQVSMEERMACGVGACLGCAVPMADGTMRHVCKDGPVFDAQEVDWDA